MKTGLLFCTLFLTTLFSMATVQAADVTVSLSIQDALANAKVKNALLKDVALYWGDQEHPKVVQTFGEFKTSKRTSTFGKGREFACQWALASAIKVLQDRALKEGGNAVINIKSNIQNNEKSSSSQFECLAGSMMVNVALKGTVVKLAQ